MRTLVILPPFGNKGSSSSLICLLLAVMPEKRIQNEYLQAFFSASWTLRRPHWGNFFMTSWYSSCCE